MDGGNGGDLGLASFMDLATMTVDRKGYISPCAVCCV